jgi:riboflavin biosynthesis pyrimidine reductase
LPDPQPRAALRARPRHALSAGPEALGPIASKPGLVDEYFIVVHPALIADGPEMFSRLATNVELRLMETKVFEGGCIVVRYDVVRVKEEGER